jgi:pimeloyl-ACP methyl ester carboxylesterase
MTMDAETATERTHPTLILAVLSPAAKRMPVAELGEVALHYETAGEGPPVLVIGGTGGDLRQAPGPFWWPGAERFSLLAYDHRDQGRSVSRSDLQPTMADFAGDALALVDHLGWDRFSVVGISFGGMVAQELALAAGARVERLVLAITSSGGEGSRSYPLHELYARGQEERAARLVELLDTRAAAQPRLAQAIPGARLEVFDGGHGVLLQDPAAWPAIADFLGAAA